MNSDNISPAEWRWVAIFSGFLVTLTLLPYAWALAASDDVYNFMGVLPNPKDGATYISKIQQGVDGSWLFELRHTPQIHEPAGFHLFYLMLGHIARPLGLSNVVIFHLARVATSFFMFFALYQLGATIWPRTRPRRWFFMLISAGSGLGWLGLVISRGTAFAPDLFVAEAFPLLAAYTNPHFPLSIGCLALLAAEMYRVLRPDYHDAPTPENGGLVVVLLSVVLAIVSPPALLVIGSVLVSYTVVRAYASRSLPLHEARWVSLVVLPGFPFAAYYYAVFRFNDVMREFNEQNITSSPNIILFILGFGLILVIALPEIIFAFRHFERDGDQLMLTWLVVNSIAVYIPFFALQRRLFIGLIIPLTYFAVRSLVSYWSNRVPEKWQAPSLIALAVFMVPTHVLTFFAPLAFAVINRDGGAETGILLATDYLSAFHWLEENSQINEVLLAAPSVGLWTPAETHLRPYYGHEFETIPAEPRLAEVRAFYRGEDCDTPFDPDLPFRVQYVFWGPRENDMGVIDAEKDDIDEIIRDDLDEFNFPDAEGVVQEPPLQRLPDADKCKEYLEERAAEQMEFGDVTLYILKTP